MKRRHVLELKGAIDAACERTKKERDSWPSGSVEFKAYTCSVMTLRNLQLSLLEIPEGK